MNSNYILTILFLIGCVFIGSLGCQKKLKESNAIVLYPDVNLPKDDPLVFAPGVVSLPGRFEMGISMAIDGSQLAFGVLHESDTNQTQIFSSDNRGDHWSKPIPMQFADNFNTFFPMYGPKGKYFYFSKSEAGAENDIWVSEIKYNDIANCRKLSKQINSLSREAGHGQTTKGNFFFTSNRDTTFACCGDVYFSHNGFATVDKIETLSSNDDEESLYVSPNEDYMLLQVWKNEFGTKHDLYISYKDKKGEWLVPSRLNAKINGPDQEQRPYVTPDNNYLFFSRFSTIKNGDHVEVESDIYWVSTDKIFTPYLYNPEFKIHLVEEEAFKIEIPKDLFRHVKNVDLTYEVLMEGQQTLPKWVEFNEEEFNLTGIWPAKGMVQLLIVATDTFGNEGKYQLILPATP